LTSLTVAVVHFICDTWRQYVSFHAADFLIFGAHFVWFYGHCRKVRKCVFWC